MIDPIIYTTKPPMNEVPGGWDSTGRIFLEGTDKMAKRQVADTAFVVENFLSEKDCDNIIAFMQMGPRMAPVSVQGNEDELDNRIGSVRTTMWNVSFAEQFYKLFQRYGLDMERIMSGRLSSTDWWQPLPDGTTCTEWTSVAISPMIRYMRYQQGGQHYAHYDAAYMYPDNRHRSLMSIVIYLTTNETGCTRLVYDDQMDKHIKNRVHKDWSREVNDNELAAVIKPVKGRMFMFDHRMCHDVSKYDGAEGDRIIIRGDLIFKATPWNGK